MSEELMPLYDKKFKCPVCSNSFTTKKLRSRFIRVDKIDNDFFTYFTDQKLNPIFYEVNVCPICGYAFADTFSHSFSTQALQLIKTQISANWKKRDFSDERTIEQAIESFKLAILSSSLKQEKNIVVAGLCLRLAWLLRIVQDVEQEKRFLQLALEKYKQSYMEIDFYETQMTEMRVLYLIGELSRQLGYRSDAVTYFSKVISHKNRAFETKLVEMAREQWFLIREEDKKIKA